MPAPLPSDQLNIIRNLIAKGDQAGAIKVYIEATGSTQAEAEREVTNLATRYGLVGTQVPDLFTRRTPPPPKPAPPAESPAAPATPPAPAPVAQQAANVPLEPAPPAPAPAAPAPASPPPPPAPAPVKPISAPVPYPTQAPVAMPKVAASPASATPMKKSRWGCSSVIVAFGGMAGIAWWILT